MALDLLRPVSDANKDRQISHIGDHNEDDADDLSMLLYPERHVLRDPTIIYMTWNVTMEERAPDGVMRPVNLINGEWLQQEMDEYESSI